MQSILSKYSKFKSVLINIGLLAFPFILPLPTSLNIKSISFIIFLAVLLFCIPFRKVDIKKVFFNKIVILFYIFYFIDPILSLIRGNGLYVQDLKLSFLIAPVIFFASKDLLTKHKNNILRTFALGTFSYIIFTIGYVVYFYSKSVKVFSFDYFLKYVTYHYLPYSIHHTYIGIYLSFTLVIILFRTNFKPYLKIILCLTIFLSGLIIASKLTTLFFLLIVLVYLFIKLEWSFYKKMLSVITLVIIFLIIVFTLYLRTDLFRTISVSISERKALLDCSLEGIDSNFFIGVGNYNVKNYIVNCDQSLGLKDTHNLFLQELLSNGLLGFTILIALLIHFTKDFLKSKSILGGFLIISIMFFGFVEHLLNLQYGVLFFLFFLLLIYSGEDSNKNHI